MFTAYRTVPGIRINATYSGGPAFEVINVSRVRIYATYSGGPYIDLHWHSPSGPVFEVINVYDYRAGEVKPDLNVSRELSEWLRENRQELANYYRNTA